MAARTDERETAVAAAERTCPRCGAPREPDQRYCLECGLALPDLHGRVPALRRRWMRRLGWYPGDWLWVSLLTFVVAAAGAAVAIALTVHRDDARSAVFTAGSSVTVSEPNAVPAGVATVDTSKLPTAPEPTATSATPRNGRIVWPRDEDGWTIVLVSYPRPTGRKSALATASKAAGSGLRQVGVLESDRYASLQPGYYVVFTGIYSSRKDADAGVPTARQAGFGGAYSRQIAR
ncbi:MAG: hypothetical protein ACRDM1_15740 [Gaiellaceae bacterium]